jgi:hypothetical protein
MPSVRGDGRPRWSVVLTGPRRKAYRGRGSPRAKPETGRRTDPAAGRGTPNSFLSL